MKTSPGLVAGIIVVGILGLALFQNESELTRISKSIASDPVATAIVMRGSSLASASAIEDRLRSAEISELELMLFAAKSANRDELAVYLKNTIDRKRTPPVIAF